MEEFQWFDAVNGAFELVGGWFTWNSAWALYKSKALVGVYPWAFWFFGFWGLWNLIFYPMVGAPLSFAGGVILVAGNIWWMMLFTKYRWIDKRGTV